MVFDRDEEHRRWINRNGLAAVFCVALFGVAGYLSSKPIENKSNPSRLEINYWASDNWREFEDTRDYDFPKLRSPQFEEGIHRPDNWDQPATYWQD